MDGKIYCLLVRTPGKNKNNFWLMLLLLFILFHIIYKYGIIFNIKFNLNIIVRGYEWEKKKTHERERN